MFTDENIMMNNEEKKRRAKQLSLELAAYLNIQSHYKGYAFFIDAIYMCALTPELLYPISKKLFPIMAENHGCSIHSIERNIRKVIDIAFENDSESFYKCLPYLDGKPYMTEVIACAAEKVRLELK